MLESFAKSTSSSVAQPTAIEKNLHAGGTLISMELGGATTAGESKKAACDFAPPMTPEKFVGEIIATDFGSEGGGGGGAGGKARKVSFAVPENRSGSNIGRKPECIIIDSPDNTRPHQENNAGCEVGADGMEASNEANILTPEERTAKRKKRVKAKKHRPRVLDKTKIKTKKNPSTPIHTNSSTPTPRTPKQRKPRKRPTDKNTISNNAPVLLPKSADEEELADSNENICRRKLVFSFENNTTADQSPKASVEIGSKLNLDIENQSTTDHRQKASVEIENKSEEGAKLQEPVSNKNRWSSLIVYRRELRLNECLKNSRKLGPNFPGVFKKARTRRPRATTFDKFFRLGSLHPTTQTRNNSVSIRLTRSQTREAVKHLAFEKWSKNSQWKGKKRRSKTLARIRCLSSFVKDMSKWQFSETFILKASAMRIKDVSPEIIVAHVEAQDEGVLNLDKSKLIENQKLQQDNVASPNEGIHDSENRKLIEQQELHPNNVDHYCHDSSHICVEDFVSLSENEDDVLASHNYDWFTEALVDYASQRIEYLSIEDDDMFNQPVVPDQHNQLIPFNNENEFISPAENNGKELILSKPSKKKRKKQIPEIDLNLDLVMSSGVNKDSEAEYWATERELFDGRVDKFIAVITGCQGHAPFSPWKGSVVDSAIGVFLTQNVSDNLSSSAYMNVSARFPIVGDHDDSDCDGESDFERLQITEGLDEHNFFLPFEMDFTSCHNSQTEVNLENQNAESISSQTEFTPGIKRQKGVKKEKNKNQDNINWDELRIKYSSGKSKNRPAFTADSVDWEAVRQTPVNELADVIKDRGMSNILAQRIKDFLDRILRDHGALDLEWLRDVPPELAKEYLLSFKGLGLKSVECIRLLSLRQPAFPVDVNISRIATRLNWVSLHDLPEGLEMHTLEEYPLLDSVQRYLAPRLMHLSHAKLYEFHCHLILFGKTLCTMKNPNCTACPYKIECRYYASKHGRPLIQSNPSGKRTKSQGRVVKYIKGPDGKLIADPNSSRNCTPIIEIPESPERECSEPELEDFFKDEKNGDYDGEDEMLTLDLRRKEKEDMSSALTHKVDFSHPVMKLKELQRLRTIHQVYELPDSHPLLAGFNKRNKSDPSPYLLAIWMSGTPAEETTNSVENKSEDGTNLGDILKYQDHGIIQGTILIPCRTVNRGSFPLNGTYFQLNQVFADHESSVQPIVIPREWVWNLKRRVLYCAANIRSICKGMASTYELGYFFHTAFMCIKGFDRKEMKPTKLDNKFHPSKKESKPKTPKPKSQPKTKTKQKQTPKPKSGPETQTSKPEETV